MSLNPRQNVDCRLLISDMGSLSLLLAIIIFAYKEPLFMKLEIDSKFSTHHISILCYSKKWNLFNFLFKSIIL